MLARSNILGFLACKMLASQKLKLQKKEANLNNLKPIVCVGETLAQRKAGLENSPGYNRKFSDEELLSYIEQNPSAILEDIAKYLSVSIPSVHARLKQCGITRKKKISL
jgi:hypothetical protein